MRLKRGLERESCDFCHKRKIKCDRSQRTARGETTCSQCDLRQIHCSVDDSNDIRIRRRRQTESNHIVPLDATSSQEPGAAVYRDENTPSVVASTSTSLAPVEPFLDNQQTPFTGDTPAFLLSDNLFDLSADSILFLDQIFMGDLASSEWSSQPLSFASSTNPPLSDIFTDDQHQDLWVCCNVDSTIFKASLRAYFTHAALCLPILLEDAFWQDYEASRCCHALIYAIACRGIPFTEIPDKWEIQQRFAAKFKESFFETQASTSGRSTSRLDDIEALALMANFQYDNNSTSSIPSHMETLFLSHDSLVMMTLQYRLEEGSSSPSESLSRAPERRTLLFWHVYGLDAFNCLDYKKMSRIPDTDVDTTSALPQNETHSYLDAILSVAIIARTMLQKLCNASSRRYGVKLSDIEALYKQLEHWRITCPNYLRLHDDKTFKTGTVDHHIQLQRCIVRLLEINCYMQIENLTDEYGICKQSNFDAEMAGFKIEYESLRAVRDGVDVCQWIARYESETSETGKHSLVDLAPNIVRNIFAGLCVWTSIRGKRLAGDSSISSPFVIRTKGVREDGDDARKRMLWEYVDTAKLLRGTAAKAVSHRDTEKRLEGVDGFLKPFMDDVMVMEAESAG